LPEVKYETSESENIFNYTTDSNKL